MRNELNYKLSNDRVEFQTVVSVVKKGVNRYGIRKASSPISKKDYQRSKKAIVGVASKPISNRGKKKGATIIAL